VVEAPGASPGRQHQVAFRDLAGVARGELVLATPKTQARYVLPDLLEGYHRAFPDIAISLHQGTSDRIARQVRDHAADFAIASGHNDLFDDLVTFPLYRWERTVLVLPDPGAAGLVSLGDLTLLIISYTHSFDDIRTRLADGRRHRPMWFHCEIPTSSRHTCAKGHQHRRLHGV
jgi:LysR family cys regulon transcriptional activator